MELDRFAWSSGSAKWALWPCNLQCWSRCCYCTRFEYVHFRFRHTNLLIFFFQMSILSFLWRMRYTTEFNWWITIYVGMFHRIRQEKFGSMFDVQAIRLHLICAFNKRGNYIVWQTSTWHRFKDCDECRPDPGIGLTELIATNV